jgi:hypothetical protein
VGGENNVCYKYLILINKKGLNLEGSGLTLNIAAFRQQA